MRRSGWVFIASAAALMLAGCSTGTSSAGQSATGTTPAVSSSPAVAVPAAATACALVSEREASAALGSDPGAGTEAVDGSNSSCKFGNYPTLLTVNLISTTGKTDFDHLKSQDTGGKLVPVSGLGDEAFAVTEGPAASIWFTHGTAMVAIVVVLGSGSNPNAEALAVARAANGRL